MRKRINIFSEECPKLAEYKDPVLKQDFKSLLSMTLCFLIILSGMLGLFSPINAFAAESSTGTLYIDINGSNFKNDDAVPIVKFYNPGNATSYATGEHLGDDIYKFVIPTPLSDYTCFSVGRYVNNNIYDELHDISIDAAQNKYKVNSNWYNGNAGGSWSTYTESPTTPPNPTTPSTDTYPYPSTSNSHSNNGKKYVLSESDINPNAYTQNSGALYMLPKVTFYDYYMDGEFVNGWRDYNSCVASRGNSDNTKHSYKIFNSAIAQYYRNNDFGWAYPLYFGDFYNWGDFIEGYEQEWTSTNGVSLYKMHNFKNNPNNSSALGGVSTSVTELAGKWLDDNGNITTRTSDAAPLPYFNEEFLLNNKLATIVESPFPLREVEKANGTKYYAYSSIRANSGSYSDTFWFSDYGTLPSLSNPSGGLKVNYEYSNNNRKQFDAHNVVSAVANAPGFFPFDQLDSNTSNNSGIDAVDFGFGMKIEIPFTLPQGGGDTSNPIVFDFKGDDDLWVFIDGVLVLDMGGAHALANGQIDFTNKKVIYNTGYRAAGTTTNNSGTRTFADAGLNVFGDAKDQVFNNTDSTIQHNITLFYMERGMWESNLEFGFSVSPIKNNLQVEKKVDVENVNSGLQEAVAKKDVFNFEIGKSSSKTNGNYVSQNVSDNDWFGSTTSVTKNGTTFSMKNNDILTVKNIFEIDDWAKITEQALTTSDTNFTYDTKWKTYYYDEPTKDIANAGNSREATVEFSKKNEGDGDSTPIYIKAEYTNTPKVGSFSVEKFLERADNTNRNTDEQYNNKEFTFTVTVDLGGTGTAYVPYQLAYTLSGTGSGSGTTTSTGMFTLKNGEIITFTGIPQGAKIKVVESATMPSSGVAGVTFSRVTILAQEKTISDTLQEIVWRNKINVVGPSSVTEIIEVTKVLENGNLAEEAHFKFRLYDSTGTTPIEGVADATNNASGKVTFDTIQFTETGTYVYVIKEIPPSTLDQFDQITYSTQTVTVTIIVEKNSITNELYVESVNYTNDAKFTNIKNYGTIKVQKKNLSDNLITNKEAKFYIIQADVNGDVWTDKSGITGTTATTVNGVATFENLDFGNYLVYEVQSPDGFELATEPKRVTIDRNTPDNYTITIDFKDAPIIILPMTGGIGRDFSIILGILMLFSATSLYYYYIIQKRWALHDFTSSDSKVSNVYSRMIKNKLYKKYKNTF